jgi:hypothetical protein
METKVNHTKLAYLLALQDFSTTLSDREQQNLKEIAKELKIQPEAWSGYIEPLLLAIVQGNPQLSRAYESYKEKLDRLGEIPSDLLPKAWELNQLVTNQSSATIKGFPPIEAASGYEQQLNNVVIVVNQADKPEEAVKNLGFLDKVKQLLDPNSP